LDANLEILGLHRAAKLNSLGFPPMSRFWCWPMEAGISDIQSIASSVHQEKSQEQDSVKLFAGSSNSESCSSVFSFLSFLSL
jgi:hypothetical protein